MKTSYFECSNELKSRLSGAVEGESECDVAVFGSEHINLSEPLYAKTVICPTSTTVGGALSCENVISCGMDHRSTLSLSYIGDNDCLLTVCRTIKLQNGKTLQPCELKRPYCNDMSVDDNILLLGVRLVTEQ
ncbi:MAG: hypothetical protein J6L23_01860 [Clostridia bacterium]|nr:hypothetical protein [Clostridia bacterium]MBQ6905386.1 hypothetical protein [Clostridia bacterium]